METPSHRIYKYNFLLPALPFSIVCWLSWTRENGKSANLMMIYHEFYKNFIKLLKFNSCLIIILLHFFSQQNISLKLEEWLWSTLVQKLEAFAPSLMWLIKTEHWLMDLKLTDRPFHSRNWDWLNSEFEFLMEQAPKQLLRRGKRAKLMRNGKERWWPEDWNLLNW